MQNLPHKTQQWKFYYDFPYNFILISLALAMKLNHVTQSTILMYR